MAPFNVVYILQTHDYWLGLVVIVVAVVEFVVIGNRAVVFVRSIATIGHFEVVINQTRIELIDVDGQKLPLPTSDKTQLAEFALIVELVRRVDRVYFNQRHIARTTRLLLTISTSAALTSVRVERVQAVVAGQRYQVVVYKTVTVHDRIVQFQKWLQNLFLYWIYLLS